MAQGGTFQPGRPLNPYFGYSTPARAMDYPITVNTNVQGRAAWGRVSYETLQNVYRAYDVARICVNHKIDELRSMPPMFLPAEGVKDDVDDEIEAARLVLERPDRQLPYGAWLSKWLESAIKYDSAPLYKRRDYNGDVIGLEVVDGKTIFPYIDENGRTPEEPGAPAYAQVIHGMIGTWFTREDMILVPFRPQEDSPYGMAPMESLLFTANTDMRMQWHFLQLFTDGSVPAGFMELPPDVSSPDQVAEWQDYWDTMVMGDQAKLHQLIAVPYGSKLTQTKPTVFDKEFPQYLMMRTAAGHGVVPQNVGLLEDVNKNSSDSQDDIQFRVNTMPWVNWVQDILNGYLQRDIGLRVQVKLDTGRDKEDRLAEAQAHQIYVEIGAESPDEVRSNILGKPIDKERPTPRTVMVQRVGPIPIFSIEGIAGRTDPETFGPAHDQPVLDQPYVPPVGVVPTPGTTDDQASLTANDQYQQYVRRSLSNEGGPNRETSQQKQQRGAKAEADGAAATPPAPAPAQQAPDDGQPPGPGPQATEPPKPVAKQQLDGQEATELAAFREFVRGRIRKGEWRDFAFYTLPGHLGAELNRGGRSEVQAHMVAKAASKKVVPGLTKRSGMISLDLDPGTIPAVPGGPSDHHITIVYLGPDVSDDDLAEACARAGAAAASMPGPVEADIAGVDTFPPSAGSDGATPAFAPVASADAHQLREHLADLSASEHADYHPHVTLKYLTEGEPKPDPVPPAHVTFTHLSVHRGGKVAARIPLGPQGSQVAKAGGAHPKAGSGQASDDWPGWKHDLAAAAFWAPLIAAAFLGGINPQQLAADYVATHPLIVGAEPADHMTALQAVTEAWLANRLAGLVEAITPVMDRVYTDGYFIGATSAKAAVDAFETGVPLSAEAADVGRWTVGDTEAAQLLLGRSGDGDGLRSLLADARITIKSIAQTRLNELAKVLAQGAADGDTPEQLANDIRGLLTIPSRAHMIALTEICRASSIAAHNVYRKVGIKAKRWLTMQDAKVCAICKANEAQGAIPIGQPFQSGDLYPPDHPNDRCVYLPAKLPIKEAT